MNILWPKSKSASWSGNLHFKLLQKVKISILKLYVGLFFKLPTFLAFFKVNIVNLKTLTEEKEYFYINKVNFVFHFKELCVIFEWVARKLFNASLHIIWKCITDNMTKITLYLLFTCLKTWSVLTWPKKYVVYENHPNIKQL